MEQEIFYILVEDRFYRHILEDGYTSDYHLEKIFDKEQILKILDEGLREYNIIVTNDENLLSKYLKAISEDEFQMLCEYNNPDFRIERYNFRLNNLEDFELGENKVNVRINPKSEYFGTFSSEAFGYFLKIKRGELVSASMNFTTHSWWDDVRSINIEYEDYNGWIENKGY
jgi:hypothetical protein